jgi:uncharacterized repeat protein (TIGR03833 family)
VQPIRPAYNSNNTMASRSAQSRQHIVPGRDVFVIQKQDQRTGRLTRGVVQDILTNSLNHPRGIKVRVRNGIVGRVSKVANEGGLTDDGSIHQQQQAHSSTTRMNYSNTSAVAEPPSPPPAASLADFITVGLTKKTKGKANNRMADANRPPLFNDGVIAEGNPSSTTTISNGGDVSLLRTRLSDFQHASSSCETPDFVDEDDELRLAIAASLAEITTPTHTDTDTTDPFWTIDSGEDAPKGTHIVTDRKVQLPTTIAMPVDTTGAGGEIPIVGGASKCLTNESTISPDDAEEDEQLRLAIAASLNQESPPQWICSVCTFGNCNGFIQCAMCGSEIPSHALGTC